MPDLLSVEGLTCGYGTKIVTRACSLRVGVGEVVCLVGHNGAGKTTLLNGILGTVRPREGRVMLDGSDITAMDPRESARRGISLVPAERFVFAELTVEDSMALARRWKGGTKSEAAALEDRFAILKARRRQRAGSLSGGERRMVSLAMALVGGPRLLMLDEVSLGLSPAATDEVYASIAEVVATQSIGVLIVEQNVGVAINASDRCYVLRMGATVAELGKDQAAAALDDGRLYAMF